MSILIHLCSIGYPSHWLSEVFVQVLEDQVVTSARPPNKTFDNRRVSEETPDPEGISGPFYDQNGHTINVVLTSTSLLGEHEMFTFLNYAGHRMSQCLYSS